MRRAILGLTILEGLFWLLTAAGVPPRVVMEILGHSGIAITMNTYAHVLPSLLGSAADGMDDFLG